MKISELKKGQKITIRCKQKEMIADIDAAVADHRGDVVLLDLIRHDGQVVDFSSTQVQLIVLYEDGLDMPKAWTNCRIQRRTVGGREYHALAAPKNSVRVNRRKVARVVLDLPGKLRVSSVKEGLDITIHDLCVNGIGILSPVKIEEQELKHLQISFMDESVDEDDIVISVEARMLWRKELKGRGFYYGCHLTYTEENLGYYVAEKLRENRE